MRLACLGKCGAAGGIRPRKESKGAADRLEREIPTADEVGMSVRPETAVRRSARRAPEESRPTFTRAEECNLPKKQASFTPVFRLYSRNRVYFSVTGRARSFSDLFSQALSVAMFESSIVTTISGVEPSI